MTATGTKPKNPCRRGKVHTCPAGWGASGLRLLSEARTRRDRPAVVFMSGFNRQAVEESGNTLAGQPLLPKPFTRDELGQVIFDSLAARVGGNA